jgi:hypothetical protein
LACDVATDGTFLAPSRFATIGDIRSGKQLTVYLLAAGQDFLVGDLPLSEAPDHCVKYVNPEGTRRVIG